MRANAWHILEQAESIFGLDREPTRGPRYLARAANSPVPQLCPAPPPGSTCRLEVGLVKRHHRLPWSSGLTVPRRGAAPQDDRDPLLGRQAQRRHRNNEV